MSDIAGDDLSCTNCNLTFHSQNDLLKHRQEKHSKNTVKCFKCQLTFSNAERFRFHWNSKHVSKTTATTTSKASDPQPVSD